MRDCVGPPILGLAQSSNFGDYCYQTVALKHIHFLNIKSTNVSFLDNNLFRLIQEKKR